MSSSATTEPVPPAVATADRTSPDWTTILLFGLTADALPMEQTVTRTGKLIARSGVRLQAATNVDRLVRARLEPELRSIIDRSDVVGADAKAVAWALRLVMSTNTVTSMPRGFRAAGQPE